MNLLVTNGWAIHPVSNNGGSVQLDILELWGIENTVSRIKKPGYHMTPG